jgi:predicted O-methyltransferase YrrM
MEKYYQQIEGWFDFPEFYDFIVEQFDNAVFVEIGTWKGKSIMYMAMQIKELGKNIKLYGIDTFEGSENTPQMSDLQAMKSISKDYLYELYLKNIEPLKEFITTIRGSSQEVHTQFEDNSLDFVFIDGNHSYEAVKKDIESWYPKIKSGGIISGHDYTLEFGDAYGVVKAVDEFFGDKFERMGTYVWYHKKI